MGAHGALDSPELRASARVALENPLQRGLERQALGVLREPASCALAQLQAALMDLHDRLGQSLRLCACSDPAIDTLLDQLDGGVVLPGDDDARRGARRRLDDDQPPTRSGRGSPPRPPPPPRAPGSPATAALGPQARGMQPREADRRRRQARTQQLTRVAAGPPDPPKTPPPVGAAPDLMPVD